MPKQLEWEKHPAFSFVMTLACVSVALLVLSTTWSGQEAIDSVYTCLVCVTGFWIGVNMTATINMIVYERPAWAVPILDLIGAFFNAVGKLFGLGYAKIRNAFLSISWHLAFAIMLVAFTILLLADATMKCLSGSPIKKSISKQENHAALKKQGKADEKVEAEASIKAQSEPVRLREVAPPKKAQPDAVTLQEVALPKINPCLKHAEEERAKAESAARASKLSSELSKAEPDSGADEWEIVEK